MNRACASLAQSAARQSHNLKVVSSSLTGGTDFFFFSPPFTSDLVKVDNNTFIFSCVFSVSTTV